MKVTLLGGIAMLAAASTLPAQDYMKVYGHTGKVEKAEPREGRSLRAATFVDTPTVDFTVTYEDVESSSGTGYDDATFGADRRAVVEAALVYVASLLNHTATLDVIIQPSEFDGTDFLAAASTLYAELNGFQDSVTFVHITTGTDPAPVAGFEDIFITTDFGYTYNLDLGNNTTGPTETDLLSVMIHEIAHGLGVATLSESDGSSQFEPTASTYTTWDELIYQTSGSLTLFSAAPAYQGTEIAGGDNSLDWRGANAVSEFGGNPPIYSPNPYETGSSLAHWQDAAPIPTTAVMRPSIPQNTEHRAFEAFELGALQDLGYTIIIPSSIDSWILY